MIDFSFWLCLFSLVQLIYLLCVVMGIRFVCWIRLARCLPFLDKVCDMFGESISSLALKSPVSIMLLFFV